jgi:hypothetical protein
MLKCPNARTRAKRSLSTGPSGDCWQDQPITVEHDHVFRHIAQRETHPDSLISPVDADTPEFS